MTKFEISVSANFCSILFNLSVPFCSTRDVTLSYPLHVKVGSSAGRQVAPPDIVSGHQVSPLEAVTSHVAFRRWSPRHSTFDLGKAHARTHARTHARMHSLTHARTHTHTHTYGQSHQSINQSINQSIKLSPCVTYWPRNEMCRTSMMPHFNAMCRVSMMTQFNAMCRISMMTHVSKWWLTSMECAELLEYLMVAPASW